MPTIIKNGRNYSGTSVSLTQAEYDALPEVTKMNGTTYFITDSEVVLNAEDVALDEGNLNDLAGSVATIETSPATANHEVGEYILWNGVVYVVTSAIATGENLVINSNISARTIGSELTALNNGLMPIDISDQFTLSTVGGIQGTIRAWYVPALKKVYGSIGAYSDGTAISTSTAFAQIAEQYRPLKIENFPAAIQRTNNALNMYMGQVTPAGYIYQLLSSTGMSIYMNFEYYL